MGAYFLGNASADLPKNGGEQPNADADIKTGPDELAAAAHLQREKHGDHPGDERNDEEDRVDDRHEKRTPQTGYHRAEKPEMASEQHRKNERRERVRNEHGQQLQVDAPGVGQHE